MYYNRRKKNNTEDDTQKKTKLNNKKTVIDGITFDSKREANVYSILKTFQDIGMIRDLRLQVPYLLIPSQRDEETGKVIERPIKYIADFVFIRDCDNKELVVDAKGMKTEKYIIKRKLMLYLNNIRIIEI